MSASRKDWQRLGEMLEASRVALDPKYKNLTLFTAERGIDYRLAWDLEHGSRANYRRPTLISAEVAYGLVPGSIARALAGGEITPAGSRADGRMDGYTLGADGSRHYDSKALQDIWTTGLPEDVRLALIELAEQMRRNRNGDQGQRSA